MEVRTMRLCRWLAASIAFAFAFALPASAQEQLKLFVGYSFLRPSVTYGQVSDCPLTCPAPPAFATNHPNLNGYEFSATYKVLPWIGAKADFSGHYGTVTGRSSGHVQNFLVGPEVALPARVSPFAHLLFGVAHQAVGAGTSTYRGDPVNVLSSSDNAFATAVGGGIDLHIAPFLSFRAIQLDYLVTRFHSETQNQPRASTGLVLRF
jgi:Outer membrane protein beta-barrel domain